MEENQMVTLLTKDMLVKQLNISRSTLLKLEQLGIIKGIKIKTGPTHLYRYVLSEVIQQMKDYSEKGNE